MPGARNDADTMVNCHGAKPPIAMRATPIMG
jgi:hypothetical protein